MRIVVNKRIQSVNESATLAVKEKADRLKALGRKIFNFGPGEPDIDTPQHIKDAAIRALEMGKTKYLPVLGLPELRDAIANKLKSENHLNATASSVIVCNGGKQAIFEALDVILEPGDEVIIPTPYWVSYPEMVRLAGGSPVILPSDPNAGYKLTPEVLTKYITKKSKVIIINTPSNPTGAAYSRKELEALAELILKSGLYVISDEVYEKIIYDNFQHTSIAALSPEMESRTITINAFSKTYSMTGWRAGYAYAPKEIIAAMGRHQSQTTSNVCSITQYAALSALSGDHTFLEKLLVNYKHRRDLASQIVKSCPGLTLPFLPDGAFFLFIRIESLIGRKWQNRIINGSRDLSEFLLDEAGVALVPGLEFGDDSAFRISYAMAEDQLVAGLMAMKESLNKLS
ncbi:MAG: pyridoxal phosphate-dependent aminotransferase [bacterium]|nr:pyridoxal phosphate-dependent aminotransferase [bacterium]